MDEPRDPWSEPGRVLVEEGPARAPRLVTVTAASRMHLEDWPHAG